MSRSGKGVLARGSMRRRLRRQQQVREALLLDLGALVFELHRQGRREPELLQAKAAELSAVDKEVRSLSDALGVDQSPPQLVSPGIHGSCRNCGALLTVDDHFCSNCGNSTEGGLVEPDSPEPLAATEPAPLEEPAAEMAPEPEPAEPQAQEPWGAPADVPEEDVRPEPVAEQEGEPASEPEAKQNGERKRLRSALESFGLARPPGE